MTPIQIADLILRVLDLVVPALTRTSTEYRNMLAMVAAGREPSQLEWDLLLVSLRAEGDRLREAVRILDERA